MTAQHWNRLRRIRQSCVLAVFEALGMWPRFYAVYGRSRREVASTGFHPKRQRKLSAVRINFLAFRVPANPIDARRARPWPTASRPHTRGLQ
jgi:hypothetical protein